MVFGPLEWGFFRNAEIQGISILLPELCIVSASSLWLCVREINQKLSRDLEAFYTLMPFIQFYINVQEWDEIFLTLLNCIWSLHV